MLTVVLLLACLLAGGATAQTRIMPLGDSISQGGQNHASYRYPLWFGLLQASYFVDFVGSRSVVFGSDPPNLAWYPDYLTSFDRDHQAYWGWRTDEILTIAGAAALTEQPDIVLIQLGTNDIGQNGAAGVIAADANLRLIIADIRVANPSVVILLAQIPPIGPLSGYAANAGQVVPLNASISSVATDLHMESSPVVLVDQYTGFDLATMMQPDDLHPNLAGEAQLASVWQAALSDFLTPVDQPPVVPISISNASFEDPVRSDGQVAPGPGSFGGWTFSGTAATFTGILNPPVGSYPSAAGDATPTGAHAINVAYLFNDGGPSESVEATQVLSETLQPSGLYVLTVAIGHFLPTQPYSPSTYGGYRIELLAGTTLIASDSDTMTPPEAEFRDAVAEVYSDNLAPALLGQPLSIRLTISATEADRSTHFDDVRLTRGALPVPAISRTGLAALAVLLIGVTLLAPGWRSAHRRKLRL